MKHTKRPYTLPAHVILFAFASQVVLAPRAWAQAVPEKKKSGFADQADAADANNKLRAGAGYELKLQRMQQMRNEKRHAEALAEAEMALKFAREYGDKVRIAYALLAVASSHQFLGDLKSAVTKGKELIAYCGAELKQEAPASDGYRVCKQALYNIAQWEVRSGDLSSAADHFAQSVPNIPDMTPAFASEHLRDAAMLAAAQSDYVAALRMMDVAEQAAAKDKDAAKYYFTTTLGYAYATLAKDKSAQTRYEQLAQKEGKRLGDKPEMLNVGLFGVFDYLSKEIFTWEEAKRVGSGKHDTDVVATYIAEVAVDWALGRKNFDTEARAENIWSAIERLEFVPAAKKWVLAAGQKLVRADDAAGAAVGRRANDRLRLQMRYVRQDDCVNGNKLAAQIAELLKNDSNPQNKFTAALGVAWGQICDAQAYAQDKKTERLGMLLADIEKLRQLFHALAMDASLPNAKIMEVAVASRALGVAAALKDEKLFDAAARDAQTLYNGLEKKQAEIAAEVSKDFGRWFKAEFAAMQGRLIARQAAQAEPPPSAPPASTPPTAAAPKNIAPTPQAVPAKPVAAVTPPPRGSDGGGAAVLGVVAVVAIVAGLVVGGYFLYTKVLNPTRGAVSGVVELPGLQQQGLVQW
jgi:hypothetical protein